MLNRHYLKPILTVNTLGKTKFWAGIAAGVIMSAILVFLYAVYFEASRFGTATMLKDAFYYDINELSYYKKFNAVLGAILGFCFTHYIWFSSLHTVKRRRIGAMLIMRATPMIIFSVMLAVIGRYASIMTFIFDSTTKADVVIDLWKEYYWWYYLLPVVIFLWLWGVVRMVYKKVMKWILYSFIGLSIWSIALTNISTYEEPRINKSFEAKYGRGYTIIEHELKLMSVYDIDISEDEVRLIKSRVSFASDDMLDSMSRPFYSKIRDSFAFEKVPFKTILLEKLHVKLRKGRRRFGRFRVPYVNPILVYIHIKTLDYSFNEREELCKLLNEEIILANELHRFDYDDEWGMDTRARDSVRWDPNINKAWTIHEWRYYESETTWWIKRFLEEAYTAYSFMINDPEMNRYKSILTEPEFDKPDDMLENIFLD